MGDCDWAGSHKKSQTRDEKISIVDKDMKIHLSKDTRRALSQPKSISAYVLTPWKDSACVLSFPTLELMFPLSFKTCLFCFCTFLAPFAFHNFHLRSK